MLLEIFPENPDSRKVTQIIDVLRKGGIVVMPTDTVYSFACDLMNKRALEKLAKLKGVKLNKANFSLICYDLSHLADFAKPIDRKIYKVMNKVLPGPYTFILNASNHVPKLFGSKKKDIGIRIPDNHVIREVVNKLRNPLAVASVHDEDEIIDYTTDPYAIYEKFGTEVDLVIDSGYGKNIPSTIIDCTSGDFEIIREGVGTTDFF